MPANSRAPSRVARHKAMDLLLDHLEQARGHASEGGRHIAHQGEIVAEKERGGRDTSRSKQLLDQRYRMYLAERY
jgi:hypothetical protein